jgi:hypothetical protein
MDNRRDKDLVGDQYNSQPAVKSSSWIFQKWRRSTKQGGSSSSGHADQSEEQPVYAQDNIQPNRRSIHQQTTHKWAFPDDVSDNWSKDVVEFYNNGDASFCYSALFYNTIKLDRRFWGTLLGNCYLSPTVRILYNLFYVNCFK